MSHIRVCSLTLVIMSIETADKKKEKEMSIETRYPELFNG